MSGTKQGVLGSTSAIDVTNEADRLVRGGIFDIRRGILSLRHDDNDRERVEIASSFFNDVSECASDAIRPIPPVMALQFMEEPFNSTWSWFSIDPLLAPWRVKMKST